MYTYFIELINKGRTILQTVLVAATAKFRQALIKEAFSLEDVELANRINQASEEQLLSVLIDCTDIERTAELSIDRFKEIDLPF